MTPLPPSLAVARCPVVSCAAAVLGEVDVLRVVQLVVLRVHDVVDHARLQVQQHRPRDVVLVVRLKGKEAKERFSCQIMNCEVAFYIDMFLMTFFPFRHC